MEAISTKNKIHLSTCVLCEAMCGIKVETDGERILSIRGDEQDPLSQGYICPKGPALKDIHEDPDRLRHPIRRQGNTWSEVSWPEAFAEVGRRISAIQRRDGNDAVGVYFGNPNVHNLGALLYLPPFLKTLATHNRYTPTSADQLPHMLASYLMFGHQLLLPVPDIDRADFMLIVGANPIASNGSMMSAPNMRRRLKDIQNRGGSFYVVDPRKTETSKLADQHVFIVPGTDALFLASILHCLLADGWRNTGLDDLFDGQELVETLVRDLSPECTEAATAVPAGVVRRIAEQFVDSNSAVCYGRIGVSTQPFGALCAWLINLINIASGNFDQPGGAMFTEPVVDVLDPRLGAESGGFNRWQSRVRELPEFSGELPVATLADEMLVEGPGRIRGMITIAGNPVLSAPNGARLDEAFGSLEFMVSVDSYLNETTRHADLILPPVSPLEREHYDVVFRALAVRNTARYSPPVFNAAQNALQDWEILSQMQRSVEKARDGWRAGAIFTNWVRGKMGPSGLLSVALKLGRRKNKRRHAVAALSFNHLKHNPHGIDLGPLRSCLRERLPPDRSRIDLAPVALADDMKRLAGFHASVTTSQDNSLLLIGRRDLRSNNSWLHNSRKLMSGKSRCVLWMHPDDGKARDIDEQCKVEITSQTGSVEVMVHLTDQIMRGVVSLPHGFGHNRDGTRLTVASEYAGVSINDLTDDARIDELSGNAAFCGTAVTVQKV